MQRNPRPPCPGCGHGVIAAAVDGTSEPSAVIDLILAELPTDIEKGACYNEMSADIMPMQPSAGPRYLVRSTAMLTTEMKQLIGDHSAGMVATINDGGTPSVSPKATFVIIDDGTIAFGNIRSPGTLANLRSL